MNQNRHRTSAFLLFLAVAAQGCVPSYISPGGQGSTTLDLVSPEHSQFPEALRNRITHQELSIAALDCEKASQNKVVVEPLGKSLASFTLDRECSYRIGLRMGEKQGEGFTAYYGNFSQGLSTAKFDFLGQTQSILSKEDVGSSPRIAILVKVKALEAAKALLGRDGSMGHEEGEILPKTDAELDIRVEVEGEPSEQPVGQEQESEILPELPDDLKIQDEAPSQAKNPLSLDEIAKMLAKGANLIIEG